MYLRTLVLATAFQYCMLCSLKSVGGLRIVLKGVSSSAVRDPPSTAEAAAFSLTNSFSQGQQAIPFLFDWRQLHHFIYVFVASGQLFQRVVPGLRVDQLL